MTEIKSTVLLYVLNGDKATNAKNFTTLTKRFGGDSYIAQRLYDDLLDPKDPKDVDTYYDRFETIMGACKFDNDGEMIDEDDIDYDEFRSLPYPMVKFGPLFAYGDQELDYTPNVLVTMINHKNSNYNVKNAIKGWRNSPNSDLAASIIIDNAHELNIDELKKNADSEIIKAVDSLSDFDELKSKYTSSLTDYDSWDLSKYPLFVGVMNHVPEMKKRFNYFIEHGEFADDAFSVDSIYAIMKSALASDDDAAHAFFVTNLRPVPDYNCIIDTHNSDYNSTFFSGMLFHALSDHDKLEEFLDYVNRPIHYIPDDLETLNNEGLQVLTAMHKSYYEHQKD